MRGRAHCTEIDFALSFGAVIVKIIDLSKTESRDFFGIILDQKNSQKLHLLPDQPSETHAWPCVPIDGFGIGP